MENINDTDTQDNNSDDTAEFDAPPVPPVPPFGGTQVEDRLVRDPHASFGGVLSGIANRFGWDTSLTRLAFVVFTLMTGGGAFIAYLLAWVIIPRARFWPPMVRKRTRSLSGRDIGLALIGAALLVTIGVGAGEAAAIVVPLALVVGGVWMLLQKPREELAISGFDGSALQPAQAASAPAEPWTSTEMPQIAPEPVEPRSKGRRILLVGLIGAILLLPVLIIGGAFAAIAFSDIDIEVSETVTPDSIETIPAVLGNGDGEYILDLTNVDFSSVDASDPVELSITQEFGRIEVLVGDDVPVEVDADVDLGDVRVLGQSDDGISPEVSLTDEDAQLVLDLSLELGEIVVSRG